LRGYGIAVEGRNVLEFGCNYGASAIVLHHLGARVMAVDVDPAVVELAKANAERYGAEAITFRVVDPGATLPLEAGWADLVVCNSVLEYVDPGLLRQTLIELDRVLRPGGILLITGTGSRLWPREVHTGRWFVNYWPRFLDRWTGRAPIRGVFPLTLRAALGRRYRNIDLDDGGKAWLRIRATFAGRATAPRAAAALAAIARMMHVGPGWLTPHISAAMVKVV
jgi:SAM-dependent methyltransferase